MIGTQQKQYKLFIVKVRQQSNKRPTYFDMPQYVICKNAMVLLKIHQSSQI